MHRLISKWTIYLITQMLLTATIKSLLKKKRFKPSQKHKAALKKIISLNKKIKINKIKKLN